MRLAHELGLSEDEVRQFPPDKFARWVAYFKIIQAPSRGRPNSKG